MKIYNTLTRRKEEFVPIDPGNVRLYACGPTVYNYAHIGNARPAVVFDLLARVLRRRYKTTYTRNITDIDDKIIAASKESGVDISTLTEKYARIYNEDMGALGVAVPDHQPRATQYLPQMIDMIEKLISAGHAYAAEGHVLFHVPSWPDYGQLSRRNRDDMIAGARVEVAPYKKDPADFVLWKPSSGDQPGWDSPWGRGRPGWHLECSAMNAAINGTHFDIHAGGEDLIFPHHENEIAQSVCAHGGQPYAKYWMHNGHLMVEGKKMSKSEGNFLLVHDLVKEIPGEVIRFVLLSAHYRQPFDWTEEGVKQARATLDRWYGILRDTADAGEEERDIPESFIAALEDDLNTPQALSELAALAKTLSLEKTAQARGDFLAAARMIGFMQQDAEAWFKGTDVGDAKEIDSLVAERDAARRQKDFTRADEIKQILAERGILLEDGSGGTKWRRIS